MLSIKNKFIIVLLIVLFSLSVVSAVDNNTDSNIQTSSDYILNNQEDSTQQDYNISTNDKNINEKSITKNKDSNKLSLNYTINNETGMITLTEYRADVASTVDWGYLYLEGISIGSRGLEYAEEPFQVNVTNIMSDGKVKIQYRITSFENIGYSIAEENTYTFNDYVSKTPVTLNNSITLNNEVYNITSTVVNRSTGKILKDNATIEYYGVNYGSDLLPTLVNLGKINVKNGVASITFNITNNHDFYPIVMNYTSSNYQGYYISREINKTYLEVPDYKELPYSSKIELNAYVYCYDKPLTINNGTVKFTIQSNDEENETILGEGQVKNNYTSIKCKIPEKYNNLPENTTIYLKTYYSGSKTNNFETSTPVTRSITIGNKSSAFIQTSKLEGRLDEVIKFTVNVTSANNIQNVPIAIKINGITIARGKTTNGTYTTNYLLTNKTFSKGSYNISFVAGETWTTTRKDLNTTLTINGYDTIIQYNKTTVKAGDIVTIKVDLSKNKTYHNASGNIGFKLDGITYKNAQGPLIVKVVNGTATFTFLVTENMIGTHNITFTYSGNYRFEEKRITFNNAFVITEGKNRQHNAVIHYNFTTLPVSKGALFTVAITDESGQYYSTGGRVGMKINGVTLLLGNPVPYISRVNNGMAYFNITLYYSFIKTHPVKGYCNVTFTFSGTSVLKETRATFKNGLYVTP